MAVARLRVRVEGVVQGVGFRPFVHALAGRLDLAGLVGNDVAGVFIEVEGTPARLDEFLARLRSDAPRLATIDTVTTMSRPVLGGTGFTIAASDHHGERRTGVSADSATCEDCLRELYDPADRRYRYPFINCTNCGPRFTITRDVPYDRPFTTMADFPMCPACATEYHDPADRRFHAQPVCCPDCGPQLTLVVTHPQPATLAQPAALPQVAALPQPGAPSQPAALPQPAVLRQPGQADVDDPIAATVELLRAGAVVAVKGLGGYHLAADATRDAATDSLRRRKHRDEKPFAVMVADLAMARALCHVDAASAALLTDRRRPIVLLERRNTRTAPAQTGAREAGASAAGASAAVLSGPDRTDPVGPDRAGAMAANPARLAAGVAPGNRQIGLMLPYTPLHHLLLDAFRGPLVLTSGNLSDEPIAFLDDDARARLDGIADAFLTHNRPIHVRVDDSVTRVHHDRPMVLRRARGYAPEPLRLRWAAPRPVLACGAELKNTFSLHAGHRVVMSQHMGDLENYPTLRSYTEGIAAFSRLFDISPEVVAHDLHPEYLSTKYALELAGVDVVGVQHHHAHIASCLADNGECGPVIGVAFDGTGFGPDGTIWGGEFLLADLETYQRLGHLVPVPMPGGAAAIRQPWRMAVSYLDSPTPSPAVPASAHAALSDAATTNAEPANGAATKSAPADAAMTAAVPANPALTGATPTDAALTSGALTGLAAAGAAGLAVLRRHDDWPTIAAMARRGVNSPPTSSAGRLFDAMAALLGVRDNVSYEGQAAIELEQRADPHERGCYPVTVADGPAVTIAAADLVRAAADDLTRGVPVAVIAARFHNGLVDAVARVCAVLRDRTGITAVALSGGVFQNVLLLDRTTRALSDAGFRVLTHSRVPPNDGGISLGQAAVAAARDRARP